ncbi:hypothetical protein JX266_014247 [Neoarthrinium moseri]|nr:hypothetical protein JX266_014247 [Neoarthrinium moseri]
MPKWDRAFSWEKPVAYIIIALTCVEAGQMEKAWKNLNHCEQSYTCLTHERPYDRFPPDFDVYQASLELSQSGENMRASCVFTERLNTEIKLDKLRTVIHDLRAEFDAPLLQIRGKVGLT